MTIRCRDQVEMDANKQADTELAAKEKKKVTSIIYRYLGFKLSNTEQKEVLCKTCKMNVATSPGTA